MRRQISPAMWCRWPTLAPGRIGSACNGRLPVNAVITAACGRGRSSGPTVRLVKLEKAEIYEQLEGGQLAWQMTWTEDRWRQSQPEYPGIRQGCWQREDSGAHRAGGAAYFDPADPVDCDWMLIVTLPGGSGGDAGAHRRSSCGRCSGEPPDEPAGSDPIEKADISTVIRSCQRIVKENFQLLDIQSGFRIADEKELEVWRTEGRWADGGGVCRWGSEVELLSEAQRPPGDRYPAAALRLYPAHPFYDWLDQALERYRSAAPIGETDWGKLLIAEARQALEAMQEARDVVGWRREDPEGLRRIHLHPVCGGQGNFGSPFGRGLGRRLSGSAAHRRKVQRPARLWTDERQPGPCAIRPKPCWKKGFGTRCSFAPRHSSRPTGWHRCRWWKSSLPWRRSWIAGARRCGCRMPGLLPTWKHLAIRLLINRSPEGEEQPTRLAEELSRQFRQVFVDEYQDTNAVQDRIFRAVSDNGRNLFMVGDVKQSIYRFRRLTSLAGQGKIAPFSPGRWPGPPGGTDRCSA